MTTQYLSVEQIIGCVVVLLRRPHFKSQAAFARVTRISPRTLSRIEAGASMASAFHLIQLDDCFVNYVDGFRTGDLVALVGEVIEVAFSRGWEVVTTLPKDPQVSLLPEVYLDTLAYELIQDKAWQTRRARRRGNRGVGERVV